MLSKNQIKLITSLKLKKYRDIHGFFVVEGVKGVSELLESNFELHHLYETKLDFIEVDSERTQISEKDLQKISFLKTSNSVLAIFKKPESKQIQLDGLTVVLDTIRDPGNLGTIIRLCDWFGVTNLICSNETVDFFNPKVVQATMGSISRVNIVYKDLELFLKSTGDVPIFGAFMDGDNIYKKNSLPKEGILVLGNEANGISNTIEKLVTERISIPRFGNLKATESLNVATATAILLSEFKR